MILPAWGDTPEEALAAQRRLAASTAVVVGCGALGCVSADHLARAGVGHLVLVDRDIVEWSNLQRQSLYTEADAREGVPKALAAAKRFAAVNSSIRITPVIADLSGPGAEALALGRAARGGSVGGVPAEWSRADVVLDGTDNFLTRYLLNDVCVKHGVPLVYAGVLGTRGLNLSVLPALAAGGVPGALVAPTPCLRCVFPDAPAPGAVGTCETAGVLGPAVGVIAGMQAAEAIKVLLGRSDAAERRLVETDLWTNRRREMDVSRVDRASCPCCGQRRFEFLEAERGRDSLVALCGSDAVQVQAPAASSRAPFDLSSLAARWGAVGESTASAYMARLRLAGDGPPGRGVEITVFRDGRAIVRGTRDPARARSLYARYVGA